MMKNPLKQAILFLLVMTPIIFGCKVNDDPIKTDEATFLKDLESVLVEIIPKEELPKWLIARIDEMGTPPVFSKLQVFKGEWERRTIYFIIHPHLSCLFCEIYYEDGKNLIWTNSAAVDDFCSTSKHWSLIYEIEGGLTTKSGLLTYSPPEDAYEFPVKPGTTAWNQFETIAKRIDALQIPDAVLATISTEGLLETCLAFPYLIDILHGNDAQHGFEALMAKFNGFRELFKRQNLTIVLMGKYKSLTDDVINMQSKSDIDKGMFSFRHFVLEFMLAQDAVLENLSEEQEKTLFLLSFEHKEIKNSYPDIFSNLNALPTYLLYAKKMRSDNRASADILDFIQVPVFVDQQTISYLENYANANYK